MNNTLHISGEISCVFSHYIIFIISQYMYIAKIKDITMSQFFPVSCSPSLHALSSCNAEDAFDHEFYVTLSNDSVDSLLQSSLCKQCIISAHGLFGCAVNSCTWSSSVAFLTDHGMINGTQCWIDVPF